MPEQIITYQSTRIHYAAPSPRERELEAKNLRLEGYVARLLAERVRIVICPECQAEREEVRR